MDTMSSDPWAQPVAWPSESEAVTQSSESEAVTQSSDREAMPQPSDREAMPQPGFDDRSGLPPKRIVEHGPWAVQAPSENDPCNVAAATARTPDRGTAAPAAPDPWQPPPPRAARGPAAPIPPQAPADPWAQAPADPWDVPSPAFVPPPARAAAAPIDPGPVAPTTAAPVVSPPAPRDTWVPAASAMPGEPIHETAAVPPAPLIPAPVAAPAAHPPAPAAADPTGTAVEPVETTDPVTGWAHDDLLPTPMSVPILPDHLRDLKAKAQEALIERMGSRLYDRSLTEEQIENYVVTELGGFLFEEDARLADHEREQLTAELLNDVLRHGPIEPFLEDDTVSEIMVNGLASIYVERSGKLERTQSQFLTEAHLRQVIERIVSKVGRRIDESSPMVDARLPDGSRVNAVIPPLAVDGPSLTIRKFSRDALTVADLIEFGTLSPSSVGFLEASVRGRLNVLVSGGTGTGKTTMLNVLSGFIPEDERIVTLEDAVELQLKQQHLVRLESRPPNVEGKGAVSIRDLVRNSLRMRPDRVIIGECRGGEAMDMLQAMNTGHDGSLSTLHANGPRDAIARLETLCLMAGMDLPVKAIREQIASAVDLIVHVSRLRDGSRRVTHISEVIGLDGDALSMADIFTFDFDAGIGADGRYAGLLCPTGQVPTVLTKLREHGVDLSADLFLPEDDFAESDY